MTREEAIRLIGWLKCTTNREDDLEAIDMAIKALKEVQKHEETFEWCHGCKEYDKENHCCPRWSKVIRNTVEEIADRPKGEWTFNPTDAIELMFTKPKCSKCGFESSDGGNYCPNCGARMKGAKND